MGNQLGMRTDDIYELVKGYKSKESSYYIKGIVPFIDEILLVRRISLFSNPFILNSHMFRGMEIDGTYFMFIYCPLLNAQ